MHIKSAIKKGVRRALYKTGITTKPNSFHWSNIFNLKQYFLSRKRDPALSKAEVGCIMCTWMEDFTVKLALESTKDFVSRFIVVDKGEGSTAEIVATCRDDWELNLELYIKPELNLRDSRQFALQRIDEPWILVQDGDMVFHTDGPLAISNIRGFMDRPNIFLTCPFNCLYGDFKHTWPGKERWAAHPILYHNNGTVRAPKHEKDLPVMDAWAINLGQPYVFNCLIKPPIRMFLRGYWRDWCMESDAYLRYPNLEKYVVDELKIDVEKEVGVWFKRYMDALVLYDEKKWGYYPKIIRNYLEKRGDVPLF